MGNESSNPFKLNIIGLGIFPLPLKKLLGGNVQIKETIEKMNRIDYMHFKHPSLKWITYYFLI